MRHSDLFGNVTDQEIKVKLFCDESGTRDWLYLGLLIVSEEDEKGLMQDILNSRCGSPDPNFKKDWINCKEKCKNHEYNDKEVHFSKMNNRKYMYYIAERWMKYLLGGKNHIRFYVQGIDRTKLDLGKFGSANRESSIYNRFFRSAVLFSLKRFFGKNSRIRITGVYHDESSALEGHDYFSWHSLYKIPIDDGFINADINKIEFIDSNHKKSGNEYSNFIQLIDLITGSIKEVFEAESPSNESDKITITRMMLPLVERIINNPWNKKSHYNYFNRYDIQFFPKNTTSDLEKEYGDMSKFANNFYRKRPLKFSHKNQMELNFPEETKQ